MKERERESKKSCNEPTRDGWRLERGAQSKLEGVGKDAAKSNILN